MQEYTNNKNVEYLHSTELFPAWPETPPLQPTPPGSV